MGGWMCVYCGEGHLTRRACTCKADGRPDTGSHEWRPKEAGPEFDTPPKGATLAAVVVIAAVALLVGGGVWLGWLLWGAA